MNDKSKEKSSDSSKIIVTETVVSKPGSAVEVTDIKLSATAQKALSGVPRLPKLGD